VSGRPAGRWRRRGQGAAVGCAPGWAPAARGRKPRALQQYHTRGLSYHQHNHACTQREGGVRPQNPHGGGFSRAVRVGGHQAAVMCTTRQFRGRTVPRVCAAHVIGPTDHPRIAGRVASFGDGLTSSPSAATHSPSQRRRKQWPHTAQAPVVAAREESSSSPRSSARRSARRLIFSTPVRLRPLAWHQRAPARSSGCPWGWAAIAPRSCGEAAPGASLTTRQGEARCRELVNGRLCHQVRRPPLGPKTARMSMYRTKAAFHQCPCGTGWPRAVFRAWAGCLARQRVAAVGGLACGGLPEASRA